MPQFSNYDLLTSLGYKLPKGIRINSYEDLQYITGVSFNEVYSQLINKVAITLYNSENSTFKSPFSRFFKTKLEYGAIIEDISVNGVQGRKWEYTAPDDPDLLKKVTMNEKNHMEVIVTYKNRNYQSQYIFTWEDSEIERAFTSEYGLNSLLNTFFSKMDERIEIDIHNYTIAVLSLTDSQLITANQVVTLPIPSDSDSSKNFIKSIKIMSGKIAQPSKSFNPLGVESTTPKANQVLIVRSDVLANLSVEYYSNIYNLKEVGIISDIIEIDSFGKTSATADENGDYNFIADENIYAELLDVNALYIYPTYIKNGVYENYRGRFTNYYYNRDYNIGIRLGKNRIIYSVNAIEGVNTLNSSVKALKTTAKTTAIKE